MPWGDRRANKNGTRELGLGVSRRLRLGGKKPNEEMIGLPEELRKER
jgi:hypothetical protein